MIVVSDTSTILALWRIGRLTLLAKVFGEIVIPSAVFDELTQLPKNQAVPLNQITWIEPKRVANMAAVNKLD